MEYAAGFVTPAMEKLNAAFNSFMNFSVQFVDDTTTKINKIAASMTVNKSPSSGAQNDEKSAPLFSMSPARFDAVDKLRVSDPQEYRRLLAIAQKYSNGAYTLEVAAAKYNGVAPSPPSRILKQAINI
jgi:hypothetical protein